MCFNEDVVVHEVPSSRAPPVRVLSPPRTSTISSSFSVTAITTSSSSSSSAVRRGARAAATDYAVAISDVYYKRNPQKLKDVDMLLTKYKGRVRELYLEVCMKYGEKPLVGRSVI